MAEHGVGDEIKKMMKHGKGKKQAIAIALSEAGKSKKRKKASLADI